MTLALQQIRVPLRAVVAVPLDQVEPTHGAAPRAARMYTRFFGQETVWLHPAPHMVMLGEALGRLVDDRPDLRDVAGIGLYTKTQTHNTPADQDWLHGLFASLGLHLWDVATVSMTNCASALAALHLYGHQARPVLVLAGEKAFHPFGNRLSVGLLGEAPVVALFDGQAGGRRIMSSHVQHLPRFYCNPDDMAEADKRAMQAEFEPGFVAFLAGLRASDVAFFANDPVVVPYNLNLPLIQRVLQKAGLWDQVITGHSGHGGHAFCSDPFINLAHLPVPADRPVLLLTAGMGVTYAALCLAAQTDQPPDARHA
jgi:3-oxoacyl-[acyl-carrier-protein] synthase III